MAAKEERKKAPRHTTPPGLAVFPRILGKPDTKFDEDGVWTIKVKFKNAKEAAPVIKTIDGALKEAIEMAKNDAKFMANLKKKRKKLDAVQLDLPYIEDEETGEVTVSFKMKASGISKKNGERWNMRPAVFDANGKPVSADTKVGGGSTVRVAYEVGAFVTPLGYGVSNRLVAVQILELVEWGGGGVASDYGFEVNETDDEEEETDEDDEDFADADDADGGDADDF